MTPLASHEEVAGTTPDYGGTAESPPDWGNTNDTSHDQELQEREPGGCKGRAVDGGKGKEKRCLCVGVVWVNKGLKGRFMLVEVLMVVFGL